MAKPIIAVSACLCGIAVRYDGSSRTDARLERLWREGLALAVCPECMGGLRVPREPAERAADTGRGRHGGAVAGAGRRSLCGTQLGGAAAPA